MMHDIAVHTLLTPVGFFSTIVCIAHWLVLVPYVALSLLRIRWCVSWRQFPRVAWRRLVSRHFCPHFWIEDYPRTYNEDFEASIKHMSLVEKGSVWMCVRCGKRVVKSRWWVPINYLGE